MRGLEAKVPPPLAALFFAALMWAVARAVPFPGTPVPARISLASGLALVGVAIVVAGAIEFHRARTTLTPFNPGAVTVLVVSGIYRFTRNPMYLGMAIVLLAWAIYLAQPVSLLGIAAFVAYIHRFQIIPEEKALRSLFPGAFGAYAGRVRRWL